MTTADSLSSSNRSSVINMSDYDVPRPHPAHGPHLVLHPQVYDVPTHHPHMKELPLEMTSALDSLEKLQRETTAAITKLLGEHYYLLFA